MPDHEYLPNEFDDFTARYGSVNDFTQRKVPMLYEVVNTEISAFIVQMETDGMGWVDVQKPISLSTWRTEPAVYRNGKEADDYLTYLRNGNPETNYRLVQVISIQQVVK